MRLRVHHERCTGCESCVLTCGFEHEGVFGLSASRIQVERNENDATFRPMVCVQCEDRFCIAACPVGALSLHSTTGAIHVDEETCTGCGICEPSCPHGGIHFVSGVKAPFICDLCGGDPTCVKTCRKPHALELAEEEGGENHG
jgi:Fe-S-cluster-containing hydrogenase component 2